MVTVGHAFVTCDKICLSVNRRVSGEAAEFVLLDVFPASLFSDRNPY